MLLTILAVFARIFSNAYSNVVQKQLTSHSEPSLKVNCFSYIALSAVMICHFSNSKNWEPHSGRRWRRREFSRQSEMRA